MKSWVKKVVKVLAAFFAVIMFVGAFMALSNDGAVTARAEVGQAPDHTKGLTDNGDGTYTLSLSVTGEAEVEVQTVARVNVLIVYDESSSMTSNNVTTNPNRNRADYAEDVMHDFVAGLRGYQTGDGSNIQIALVGFGPTANQRSGWTSNLADSGQGLNRFFDEGVDGTVTAAHNYNQNNGTNWEAALQAAQTLLNSPQTDSDPTFVILVTDGACTASGNGNNAINPNQPPNRPWTDFRPFYNEARNEAFAIQSRSNTTLFGIYAYGTEADLLDDLIYYSNEGADRSGMNGGTVETDNYFNAGNTDALNAAIQSIFQKIVDAMGVGSVSITDGTTHNVQVGTQTVELLEIVPNSFNYFLDFTLLSDDGGNYFINNDNYKVYVTTSGTTATFTWTDSENVSRSATYTIEETGVSHVKVKWTEETALYPAPPTAINNNGTIDWDLNSLGTLLNGVTYTVTFDVYPSQTTLDYVADIRNDPGENGAWAELDPAIQQYITVDGELRTNTTASVTYTDTREENPQPHTSSYENPEPVENSAVEQMAVSKEWDNQLEDEGTWDIPTEIVLPVMRDTDAHGSVTLNDDNDWEDTVYISIGIMGADGKPLEGAEGHDFTFSEIDSTYQWELDVPTVHPMLINNVPTMLVMEDKNHQAPEGATTYEFNDNVYYVDNAVTSLSATNERRSSVNVVKAVDGADAPADARFPFAITVVNSLAPETEPTNDPGHDSDYWVWFSVWDENQAAVTSGVTGDGVVHAGETSSWYYMPSGSTATIPMGAGYSVRLNNLPTGSTYTITEGDMPSDAFSFVGAEIAIIKGTGTSTASFEVNEANRAASGAIEETNTIYQVTLTNEYALTDIEVTKVWDDSSDLDGIRPTAAEFAGMLTLSADPEIDLTGYNPTVTVDPDNADQYIITYTGLPRYYVGEGDEREAIAYSVTEEEPQGYYANYADGADYAIDGGMITNIHEIELISVTVTKEWDDDDDSARPDSVTVQLLNGKGEAVGEAALNADNGWTYTWENLPASAGEYSVSEAAVEGYMSTIAMEETDEGYSFTITNHNHGFTIEKVWEDENDHDGIRPDSVTVTVTGTVTESGKPQSEDEIEVVEVTPVDGVDTDDEEPTLRGAAPAETDAEDEDDAAAAANDDTAVPADGNDAAPANDDTAPADGNDAAPANDDTAPADGNDAAAANDDTAVPADGNDAVPVDDNAAAPVDGTGDDQAAAEGDEAQQADPTFRLKRAEDAAGEEVVLFSIDVVLSEENDWTVTLTEEDLDIDYDGYSWDDITFTVEEAGVPDGYEVSYEENGNLGVTVTNTHEVPDPVQVTLSATKILNGRDLQAGEFSFQLLDANGAAVQTVTNAADGSVSFSAISFDRAGTYTYSIVEMAGNLGGITYDTTKINVTVTVTNNEGTLTAAVAYSTGDAAQFTNTYEPADATATITARKVLTGRALQAGEFSFQLLDANGAVIQTVTNAADGSIAFAPITYSSEGTYTYTIAEVAGSAEGVTYDSHRFTVTVTVEDNGQGALVATVSYPTQPVFSNIYVSPIVPTGDHTNVMFYTVLALAAAAVCVGTLISRRRAR